MECRLLQRRELFTMTWLKQGWTFTEQYIITIFVAIPLRLLFYHASCVGDLSRRIEWILYGVLVVTAPSVIYHDLKQG